MKSIWAPANQGTSRKKKHLKGAHDHFFFLGSFHTLCPARSFEVLVCVRVFFWRAGRVFILFLNAHTQDPTPLAHTHSLRSQPRTPQLSVDEPGCRVLRLVGVAGRGVGVGAASLPNRICQQRGAKDSTECSEPI